MARIESFRNLDAYRMALREAKLIYEMTASFPKEERYALTDQIRRSSRAVAALIAEGWARRRYQAAFVNKMNEALGEAMETQAWLDHARMANLISEEAYRAADDAWQHIGGKLRRMEQRAESFCGTS